MALPVTSLGLHRPVRLAGRHLGDGRPLDCPTGGTTFGDLYCPTGGTVTEPIRFLACTVPLVGRTITVPLVGRRRPRSSTGRAVRNSVQGCRFETCRGDHRTVTS